MNPPSESFRQYVLPPWQAYQNDPSAEWKAHAAARAANAHLEWVFRYYEKVDKSRFSGAKEVHDFRNQLCSRCPEISDVKEIDVLQGSPRGLEGEESHPIPQPTGDLYFETALALAFASNPELASRAWELRAAKARTLQAGLRANPELEVEVPV